MKKILLSILATLLLGSFVLAQDAESGAAPDTLATAYFAGGCFWCVEADFEKHEGVVEAVSGYMGGEVENPTYKQVSSGTTGHREIVEVRYDPEVISYQELLDIFWRLHDPTDAGGSFVDRGFQYGSAIYYANEEQQRLAEGSKEALNASGKFNEPVVTEIVPASEFYVAEDYHQDYYEKNALKYRFYRAGSGRDGFIKRNWKGDTTVYQLAGETAQQ